MKRFLVIATVAAVVVLSSCDPFGTDETKVYITGVIYEDAAHTIPAEGITVIAHGDSVNTWDRSVETSASGVFWIEMPLYPSPGEEGMGYVLPGYAVFGLTAHQGAWEYVYSAIKVNPFVVEVGDTLEVWDIDLTSYKGR